MRGQGDMGLENALRIHIEMRQKDGSVEHEEHDYYRVSPE